MAMNPTADVSPSPASPASEGQPQPASAASRAAVLAYGIFAYVLFFATFLYLIGFVGGFVVPKTLDSGVVGQSGPLATAILINVLCLGVFGIQHTIMARPAFKRAWTKIIPAAAERSTFVLVTSVILIATVWLWQPLPEVVWHVEGPVAWLLLGISFLGWGVVLASTFIIDHFDLFGLRQTVTYALGREYVAPRFKEILFYRWVRHPLMVGFLIAFWSTPHMTQSHLLFAVTCTAYILVGVRIEEKTLVELHGEDYEQYRRRVRGLLPIPRRMS